MRRALLLILALLGMPLMFALGLAFLRLIASLINSGAFGSADQLAFLGGAIGMIVAYFLVGKKWIVTYVFAHELTHAIAGLMCFARISSFHVSSSGGYVQLSKSNLFITLAPYCVPLYLLFAVLIQVFCAFNSVVMSAIFGILTLFHVLYTAESIFSVAQPDFRDGGFIFSYWWVFSCNLFFAFLALLYTQNLEPVPQWRMFFQTIGQTYQSLWHLKDLFL